MTAARPRASLVMFAGITRGRGPAAYGGVPAGWPPAPMGAEREGRQWV